MKQMVKINNKIGVETVHGLMLFNNIQDAYNFIRMQKNIKYNRVIESLKALV